MKKAIKIAVSSAIPKGAFMTDQQLYDIAKNEDARMRDRYTAARQLQERRKRNEICWD